MPEVSVIMGVHNAGRFLAATVASLQAQTSADWELVLVDNGSTDGAVAALVATNPDPRVRIFRYAEPLLPGGALAVASRAATGRYLAAMDQDDLALPRRLEIQRAYLELQPDVMLLGSATELIDAADRPLGLEPFVGLHEQIYGLTAYVHVLRHSGVMFRRELLERVQYRSRTGGAADFDFFARATEVGRVAAVPAVLCRYRLHPGNYSNRGDVSAIHCALVRMLTRRRRSGLPEDLDRWADRFETGALGRDTACAHLHCARIFAQENCDDLAALHAWLAYRAGGSWRAAGRYAQATGRGLIRSEGTTNALVRAWLKEPAHRLMCAGGAPERHQF